MNTRFRNNAPSARTVRLSAAQRHRLLCERSGANGDPQVLGFGLSDLSSGKAPSDVAIEAEPMNGALPSEVEVPRCAHLLHRCLPHSQIFRSPSLRWRFALIGVIPLR